MILEHYTTTAATINRDITFTFQASDVGNLGTEKSFWQNTYSLSELDFIDYQSRRIKKWITPESSGQNTNATFKLFSTEEYGSGATQEFADTQQQLPAFLFYNEDDILNLDADIPIPEPRESGTIRVKLIYEEPSKPLPVEDPWEE